MSERRVVCLSCPFLEDRRELATSSLGVRRGLVGQVDGAGV